MPTRNFKAGVVLVGDGTGAQRAVKLTRAEIEALDVENRKAINTSRVFSRQNQRTGRSMRGVGAAARLATTAVGALAAGVAGIRFVDTLRDTERLRASLVTVTGDVDAAGAAFDRLVEFAGGTPFTLDQSINAFIKLSNLGIEPTEARLQSFGNTAAAMGRDLSQFIEAVADASTNEFERLKEFGIKAKQEADTVAFTFQGVTTTVEKNSEAIVDFLQRIGEENFGDAMAVQMERLPGLFSNLEDSVTQTFLAIGDAGAITALEGALRSTIEVVDQARDVLPVLAADTELLGDVLTVLATAVIARQVVPALGTMANTARVNVASLGAIGAAAKGANAAVAALGGPAGVVLIAVGALITFTDVLKSTEEQAAEATGKIDRLASSFERLGAAGQALALREARDELQALNDLRASALAEIDQITERQPNAATQRARDRDAARVLELRAQIEGLDRDIATVNEQLVQMNDQAIAASIGLESLAVNAGQSLGAVTEGAREAAAATAGLTDAQQTLLDKLAPSAAEAREFAEQMATLRELEASGAVSAEVLAEAYATLEGSTKAATEAARLKTAEDERAKRAAEQHAESLERLRRELLPLEARQEDYARDLALLNELFPEAERSSARYAEALGNLTRKYAEQHSDVRQLSADTNAYADAVTASAARIDEAWTRVFTDGFSGVLDAFKQTVAEMAHFAITRPILLGVGLAGSGPALAGGGATGAGGAGGVLGALFGGGGGGFGFGSGAGLLQSLLGPIFGPINASLGQGALGVFNLLGSAGLGGAANFLGRSFFNTAALGNSIVPGGGAALGGLATFGAGFAGTKVGELIADAFVGKVAESNIGATVGGVGGALLGSQIGAIGGPIGAAVGGILGSLTDAVFGGDGNKRNNFGIITGGGNTGERFGEVVTAASGLQLQTFLRRATQDQAAAASGLLDAVVQIDSALTALARSAGVDVDFSNTALRGVSPDFDSSRGDVGSFFGGRGFNGDGSIADAADRFVVSWLDEVNDSLSERVRGALSGVARTADELVTAFEAALQIEKLLSLDVVGDTAAAMEALERAQRPLFDQYDALTESAVTAAAELDGTGGALAELASILGDQKLAALELAIAYQTLGDSIEQQTTDARERVLQTILSEEQLHNRRRDQVDALVSQLRTAVDPLQVQQLFDSASRLGSTAFGALTEDQQQRQGDDFLAFFDGLERLAQERLSAGQALLADRETAVNRAVDLELLSRASSQQTQAAQTFETAVTQFSDLINQFGGSVTLLEQIAESGFHLNLNALDIGVTF